MASDHSSDHDNGKLMMALFPLLETNRTQTKPVIDDITDPERVKVTIAVMLGGIFIKDTSTRYWFFNLCNVSTTPRHYFYLWLICTLSENNAQGDSQLRLSGGDD